MNTADQLGIDALANAGAKGIMNAGRNLKAYQPARMQLWLLLSVASFLLILLGLIYFSRF